jgi:hypothetical protein
MQKRQKSAESVYFFMYEHKKVFQGLLPDGRWRPTPCWPTPTPNQREPTQTNAYQRQL